MFVHSPMGKCAVDALCVLAGWFPFCSIHVYQIFTKHECKRVYKYHIFLQLFDPFQNQTLTAASQMQMNLQTHCWCKSESRDGEISYEWHRPIYLYNNAFCFLLIKSNQCCYIRMVYTQFFHHVQWPQYLNTFRAVAVLCLNHTRQLMHNPPWSSLVVKHAHLSQH